MLREFQECRVCKTPVIKKKGGTRIKPKQKYYYKYYLFCPKCRSMFMLESEKVMIDRVLYNKNHHILN